MENSFSIADLSVRASHRKTQGWESGGSAIGSVVKIDFASPAHVQMQELNLHSPHIGVG